MATRRRSPLASSDRWRTNRRGSPSRLRPRHRGTRGRAFPARAGLFGKRRFNSEFGGDDHGIEGRVLLGAIPGEVGHGRGSRRTVLTRKGSSSRRRRRRAEDQAQALRKERACRRRTRSCQTESVAVNSGRDARGFSSTGLRRKSIPAGEDACAGPGRRGSRHKASTGMKTSRPRHRERGKRSRSSCRGPVSRDRWVPPAARRRREGGQETRKSTKKPGIAPRALRANSRSGRRQPRPSGRQGGARTAGLKPPTSPGALLCRSCVGASSACALRSSCALRFFHNP